MRDGPAEGNSGRHIKMRDAGDEVAAAVAARSAAKAKKRAARKKATGLAPPAEPVQGKKRKKPNKRRSVWTVSGGAPGLGKRR